MDEQTRPGPFQVILSADESAEQPSPERRYSCIHYQTCLELAAALNWDSFTCKNCSEEVDQSLYWRAHQERKRDKIIKAICTLPEIPMVSAEKTAPTKKTG